MVGVLHLASNAAMLFTMEQNGARFRTVLFFIEGISVLWDTINLRYSGVAGFVDES
jgi:hypothetical protein